MKKYKVQKSSGGLSTASVIQLIFIVLKLTKLINWSWWAVFIPTFISLGVCTIACAVVFIVTLIQTQRK